MVGLNRREVWICRWLLVVLLCACSIATASAKGEEDDEIGPHRFGFMGALTSSDTWQLEMGYHYMLCPWVGLGGEFGMWKQYYYDGLPGGRGWEIDSDDELLQNLYLRPSVLLVSPALFHIRDARFGLVAEPGVMLNIPYQCVGINKLDGLITTDYVTRSSSRGQWCAVDCRVGLNVKIGRLNVTAGYLVSNFDIYGIARNIRYDGVKFGTFYPKKKLMQGAYLSLTANI